MKSQEQLASCTDPTEEAAPRSDHMSPIRGTQPQTISMGLTPHCPLPSKGGPNAFQVSRALPSIVAVQLHLPHLPHTSSSPAPGRPSCLRAPSVRVGGPSFLFFFFYFINLFYLFIFGCMGSSLLCAGFLQLRRAGATLCCGARASHGGGFSCCGARALGAQASVVVACGLQQLWHAGSVVVARGLQSTGSVIVVHGLSCSTACGIFPDQGSNPCPLHWQEDS